MNDNNITLIAFLISVGGYFLYNFSKPNNIPLLKLRKITEEPVELPTRENYIKRLKKMDEMSYKSEPTNRNKI